MSPIIATSAFATAGDAFELIRSLLNDADIPSTSNIAAPATGAVRVSNIVTITTTANHGLMVGMRVTVTTTDSGFNGTFTIATVPTLTSFTYLQTAANATSGNGIVQLMIQGDVFTDNVLLQYVKKSYRKCQSRLNQNGSKSLIKTDELTLAAGDTEFTDTSNPALFSDFLTPRKLYQKISGSSNHFADMGEQCNQIPDIPASGYIQFWAWQEDGLKFSPATQDLDIRIRYTQGLPGISNADSQLLLRGILDPVASGGAYYAALRSGDPRSIAFKATFEEDIQEFLNVQAHARQYQPVRRAPYGGSGRCSGMTGFF